MINTPYRRVGVGFAIGVVGVLALAIYLTDKDFRPLVALILFVVDLFMLRNVAGRAGTAYGEKRWLALAFDVALLLVGLAVGLQTLLYIQAHEPFPLWWQWPVEPLFSSGSPCSCRWQGAGLSTSGRARPI